MANLYEVVGGGRSPRRLLLECGLPWKKLEKALDYDLSNIDGCFITHEHKDHCRAIEDIMKAGINVYASEGTFEVLGLSDNRRAMPVRDNGLINEVGSTFVVMPYSIEHDAAEPLGYIVHDKIDGDWLLFCPDSAFLKQRFNCMFTIVALEVSYDREILHKRVKDGDIHEEVAKRIVKSHAEKNTTLKYLQDFCDLSRCREIHLLHCSGVNLDKRKTKAEYERKLFIETIIK